ncbi:MAG: hypothetical protein HY794_09075 [Desulfarculus sp.]|nr:hypothetical protein [Desulfarculus sp.]
MSGPGPIGAAGPQDQHLRQVYEALLAAQARLIAAMGLSELDPRLAPAREEARRRFLRAWPRAIKRGLAKEPQGASDLYLCCLARGLSRQGLSPPPELLPAEGLYFALAAEVLS